MHAVLGSTLHVDSLRLVEAALLPSSCMDTGVERAHRRPSPSPSGRGH